MSAVIAAGAACWMRMHHSEAVPEVSLFLFQVPSRPPPARQDTAGSSQDAFAARQRCSWHAQLIGQPLAPRWQLARESVVSWSGVNVGAFHPSRCCRHALQRKQQQLLW